MDEFKSEFKGSASSMQRHSVNLRSYQLQNGHSKGAATATQKSDINLDVKSKLSNNSKELNQSTEGSGIMEQTSSTKNAARLLQSQSNTTAVYHFQASIEGGPSIQNQMLQIHVFNFHLLLKNKITLIYFDLFFIFLKSLFVPSFYISKTQCYPTILKPPIMVVFYTF